MDFTTLMEKVEAVNGRGLSDECHGLIADYVREKIAPQSRMQKQLEAIQLLHERFKHLDGAIRSLADDEESDVVHRIAKELWMGLSDCVLNTQAPAQRYKGVNDGQLTESS